MKSPCKEVYKETVGSIFVSHQLYLHGSELNSPADSIINWYFKSDRIPISVVHLLEDNNLVISHFFELFVDIEEISFENISDMVDKIVIYFHI